VLFAGEALFLRRGDNFPVAHEAGRAVVIVGGNAEDVHGCVIPGSCKLSGLFHYNINVCKKKAKISPTDEKRPTEKAFFVFNFPTTE
jgi:hypothetical protein